MKFLLYAISFIFLDAIVPKSCRNEQYQDYNYEEETDSLYQDSIDDPSVDSLSLELETQNPET